MCAVEIIIITIIIIIIIIVIIIIIIIIINSNRDLGDGAGLLGLLEDALRELAEEDRRGARPDHFVGDGGRLLPRAGGAADGVGGAGGAGCGR